VTRIDFYTGSTDKLRTVCQLSHKAMQSGVRAVISSPDAATGDALDRLLWHYPATAFIPHCRSDADEARQTPVLSLSKWPVVIDHGGDKFPHHDLLISRTAVQAVLQPLRACHRNCRQRRKTAASGVTLQILS
jgi:DNA polymerase-3 subunit chi